ncbi:MAG: murein biosynthesis integral membrane protein MurJ [Deltaproteobacteria bacterium]|nr:murein biosynthesis integral membrane protein MurJ [Deltaproteobacteria bacterium]
MSVITIGSRVLGLVREQVRAHYLGTSMASDAFGLAFQIPNLLRRLVAEGAMSAGFIPVLSEVEEQEGTEAAMAFANRYFNLVMLALTLISGLGMLGASVIVGVFALLSGREISPAAMALTTNLTQWMFPYIGFMALAAVAQGVLNTYRVFWVSAASSIAMNVAIIAAAIGLSGHMNESAYAFAIGVLIGGVLQFGVQIPSVVRLGYRWSPDFKPGPRVKKALWLLVPTLFGAGVYQVNVMVSQAIAWGLGGGAVSSLQYSSRLLELTLGVFAVAISTVVLPTLSRDAAGGRLDEVRDTVLYAVRLCCFVCFPMLAGLFLLRAETASLLFERGAYGSESTRMTSYALAFHLMGLVHIALARIYVPVFYAFKDTRTPVLVAFVAMFVNVGLCYALDGPFGHGGIALANTASAFTQAFALSWFLRRHTGPLEDKVTGPSVLRSAAGTLAMGAVVLWLSPMLIEAGSRGGELLLPYVLLVAAAVVTYVATALATRHPELTEVIGIVRRRVGR